MQKNYLLGNQKSSKKVRTKNEFIRLDKILLVEGISFLVFSYFHVILAIKVLLSNMMHVVSPKLLENKCHNFIRSAEEEKSGDWWVMALVDIPHLRFILIA